MSFKRSTTKTTNSSKSSNIVHIDRISGIKPWINGQYFVSFGLRQLDELFGGGNALGTLCVLEEDQYSNHGTILFNYNIAEALSHGYHIINQCRLGCINITININQMINIYMLIFICLDIRNYIIILIIQIIW